MPFPTTLSAGQLTQVRKTTQAFKQYLLLCPNSIVFQTQPDENLSNEVYAEFAWTGTLQGARTDVKEGQTVLITTSASDLSTVVFRGRVRVVPGTSDFYINETSATLTTAHYVTVLDDWDIHEKLERRLVNGTEYKDWELTFSKLPPLITGLQSVYVDTSATATVDIAFAPTGDATADGESISTWLWNIADGSFQVGSSSTQNITARFPGAVTNEHRWVTLTITDSNGVSTYFAFEVYTIDLTDTSAGVIALNTGDVNITGAVADGFNATVRAWAGFTSVLDRTRCTLLSVDDYDGISTPITQNVSFIGRLRQEGNYTTGDPIYSVLQDTQLTIEGFVTQLGRLHGAGLYLQTDSTPTAWGEIKSLTIKRALVYMLAWHSTYLNVSGVTFDASSDDYEWPEFVVQESSLLGWVNSVADDQNAILVTSADGQATFQRDARITGVGGLTTILTFETEDLLNFTLEDEYIATHSQAIVGAATYNTTTGSSAVYIGRAPAQAFSPGWETAPLNQQIMKSDLTDAQARTETGSRVANYLATVNPRPRMTVELMAGFYWVVPTVNQLYAFAIAATDNTRGRVYTSADKWLCTEVNYSYNVESGYYIPTASFELVVAGGASGIQVTLVPDVNDLRLPILPGIGAGFNSIIDPLINYVGDLPDYELPGLDYGITQPAPYAPQPPPSCEALNVSMKTGSIVTTSESTVFGEPYVVTVGGQGQVATSYGSWSHSIDFTAGSASWAVSLLDFFPVHAGQGVYVGGTGWQTTYVEGAAGRVRGLSIYVTVSSFSGISVLTDIQLIYDLTNSGQWDGTPGSHGAYWGSTALATTAYETDSSGNNKSLSASGLSQSIVSGGNWRTKLVTGRKFVSGSGDPGGQATAKSMAFSGTGTNPFTSAPPTDALYGDAFYCKYDTFTAELYPGANGFQVDSARPSGLSTYQSSHQYQFVTTGTGSPLGFRFLDSDYSDNDNNHLAVMICGSGMKQG